MIEKQIILKNLLINYYMIESDEKTAKSVIFLHGWRSNAMIWLPVVKLLAKGLLRSDRSVGARNGTGGGYNIYCLDLPGFGKSEFPQRPFHLKDYAEVVAEFIKKLDLRGVNLVGHSFGGRVAVKLVVEYPGIIQKLILADCGGFRRSEWQRGFITFFAKITGPGLALPLLRALRPRIYNILGAEDYLALPELKNTFINIINEDLLPLASKIRTPTLIHWGENDGETPVDFGKALHHTIPNSRFFILKDAGHFSFLDKPNEFVRELIQFFSG